MEKPIIEIKDITEKQKELTKMMVNNICFNYCPRNTEIDKEKIKTIFLKHGFVLNPKTQDINPAYYEIVKEIIAEVMNFKDKGN